MHAGLLRQTVLILAYRSLTSESLNPLHGSAQMKPLSHARRLARVCTGTPMTTTAVALMETFNLISTVSSRAPPSTHDLHDLTRQKL